MGGRIEKLAASLAGRGMTSVTLVERAIRDARRGLAPGAFVEVYAAALDVARLRDAERSNGADCGLLHGIPVAVKDNIDVAGQQVRNGTPEIGHRTPTTDADVWRRLKATGAVLIGRTRMSELAMWITTAGAGNPWAPSRSPGGSSGGSAAAVAAGVVPLALGTDTGGSIRVPAGLCGVAGLRPTHGTVSRRGVTPLAATLDTVGPIATTAADCLLAHGVLCGRVDPVPATFRVGVVRRLWEGRVAPAVEAALSDTVSALRADGVQIVELNDLPLARQEARRAFFVRYRAEAAAAWKPEYDAAVEADPDELAGPPLRPESIEDLAAGAGYPATDYIGAHRTSADIRREVTAVLRQHELSALLLPATAVTAQPSDASEVVVGDRSESISSAYSRFAAISSVTGLPALSVPCALDSDRLPIGAQLIGPRYTEATLCGLGTVIENTPGGRSVSRARARLNALST